MFDEQYIIPAFVAGTIALLVFLAFIVMIVMLARRKRQESDVRMKKIELEHQNQLLVTKLQEHERAMADISAEIHDNVAQQIDLLMMHLKAAESALTDDERQSALHNGQTILTHISNELRNASYSLNGDYIKLHGLLNKELNFIRDTKKMECILRVEEYYRSMHPETELLVFRIAQEALHNVTKYSYATELNVLLQYQPSVFTMVIADNGVGFSLDSLPGKRQTLGIQSMNQRASLLDARLEIDTAPDEGCTVTLEMSRPELYLN